MPGASGDMAVTEDQDDLYARISHSRTADEVVQQIELLILEGILRDGDRLPGERDLSRRFEVSRPILREALKELEARGLVESRHGGGTFVADVVGQIFSKPLIELIGRHHKATQDYLEFRRELEGLTAELAATRATDFDRDILTRVIERMRAAYASGSFDDELEADIELHNAIGESAHNIILLHTLRACYRLLTRGIFFHRSAVFGAPGARALLLAQHEAIYAAVMARDPVAAKMAAQDHIDFVAAAAQEVERNGEWSRIARLRLQQRDRSGA
ncbi:FadR family transcriptional regulator [Sinorhizobium medicae]|nr:FadR family transcriptional regulator [Sinorhizobium medicae]